MFNKLIEEFNVYISEPILTKELWIRGENPVQTVTDEACVFGVPASSVNRAFTFRALPIVKPELFQSFSTFMLIKKNSHLVN